MAITATPQRLIWVSRRGHDGSAGTEGEPLRTIQAAIQKATPGTAIMVKAGTYTENVKFTVSGSDDAPIWLLSADGRGAAKIVPANHALDTVSGWGKSNLVIKDFDITGPTNANSGINFGENKEGQLARNLWIEGNIVHGGRLDGIKLADAVGATVIANTVIGGSQEGIDLVTIKDSYIAYNEVSGVVGNAGILVKGGSSQVRIEGNHVHDVGRDGIVIGGQTRAETVAPYGYQARDITVVGNEVERVEKRAINFIAARDVVVEGNRLAPQNGYSNVVNIGEDTYSLPGVVMNSSNITLRDNIVSRADWLRVKSGQGEGLVVEGNVVTGPWVAQTGPDGYAAPGTYMPPASARTTVGTTGNDSLAGTARNDRVEGKAGNDMLSGLAGRDRLYGGDGKDKLDGGRGKDELVGGTGRDQLAGGADGDRLVGGAGADRLAGGLGSDTFVFLLDTDIGGGGMSLAHDVVLDFSAADDLLDFSALDAVVGAAGNNAFSFIGTNAFSSHAGAGHLRYFQVDAAVTSADRTFVEGDTNGDDMADFQLELVGLHTLVWTNMSTSDLVL